MAEPVPPKGCIAEHIERGIDIIDPADVPPPHGLLGELDLGSKVRRLGVVNKVWILKAIDRGERPSKGRIVGLVGIRLIRRTRTQL
jgi:hypothetical protein